LRLELRAGATADVASHLRAMLERPPFSRTAATHAALGQLDLGDLDAALHSSLAVFAEVALDKAGEIPQAIQHSPLRLHYCRMAADLAPDWARAQSRCASALIDLGRNAEARTCLERLRAIDPRDVALRVRMAVMQLSDGEYADARRELADAVEDNPAEPDTWLYLGYAELALGRKREAVAAFERFLVLAPDSPQAAQIRSVLENLKTHH